MTTDPAVDPLFDALAELAPLAPGTSVDRRIRSRCHALLTQQRAKRMHPRGVADLTVVCAVAVYVIAVLTEAIDLLGALPG